MLTKEQFHEKTAGGLRFLDGATGSNLRRMGMPNSACTEEWVLAHPDTDVVQSMDRMLGAFTADVDYNLPSLSSYAQDLGASISANASTQITVPVEIDGREVARATAWYTNEQLAWETR